MTAHAHLRIVDTSTGEAHEVEEHPLVQELRDQLKGAERDLNAWRLRYYELKRDKDREAREHAKWPEAKRLHDLWRELTGSKRAKWTPDRFWQIEPLLSKFGPVACELAIRGRVFDHWTARRKNGSLKHFWEWERLFANQGEFEESCKKAPADVRERLMSKEAQS